MKQNLRIQTLVAIVVFATLLALAGTASAKAQAPESESRFAVSNNAFAVDLYRQLVKENAGSNLFFSPYSVSNALANPVVWTAVELDAGAHTQHKLTLEVTAPIKTHQTQISRILHQN